MNTAVDQQDEIEVYISDSNVLVIQQEEQQSGKKVSILVNWENIDQFIFACQQAKKDATK